MPEPEHTVSEVGEFLQRKAGPLPYWAWGAAGILVIGGTIWMSKHGGIPGLDALTSGGDAGGAGAGGIPPDDSSIARVINKPEPFGAGDPLLIGQQSSFMDGGLSGGGIIPSDDAAAAAVQRFLDAALIRSEARDAILVQSFRQRGGSNEEQTAQDKANQPPNYTQSFAGSNVEQTAQDMANQPLNYSVLSSLIPTTQTQQVQYIPPTYYQQSPPSYNPPAPEPYIAPDITTSQPGTTTTQPGI